MSDVDCSAWDDLFEVGEVLASLYIPLMLRGHPGKFSVPHLPALTAALERGENLSWLRDPVTGGSVLDVMILVPHVLYMECELEPLPFASTSGDDLDNYGWAKSGLYAYENDSKWPEYLGIITRLVHIGVPVLLQWRWEDFMNFAPVGSNCAGLNYESVLAAVSAGKGACLASITSGGQTLLDEAIKSSSCEDPSSISYEVVRALVEVGISAQVQLEMFVEPQPLCNIFPRVYAALEAGYSCQVQSFKFLGKSFFHCELPLRVFQACFAHDALWLRLSGSLAEDTSIESLRRLRNYGAMPRLAAQHARKYVEEHLADPSIDRICEESGLTVRTHVQRIWEWFKTWCHEDELHSCRIQRLLGHKQLPQEALFLVDVMLFGYPCDCDLDVALASLEATHEVQTCIVSQPDETQVSQQVLSESMDAAVGDVSNEMQSILIASPRDETHHDEMYVAQKTEEDLQRAVSESIKTATHEEQADVAKAIMHSKADAPVTSDGVVLIRLKRIGKLNDVRTALIDSPHLAEPRSRVAEAGCEVMPEWTPAILLVPLTQAQVKELDVQLSVFHVIAHESDKESILAALKEMPSKKRPSIVMPRTSAGTYPAEDNLSDCAGDVLTPRSARDNALHSSLFAVERTFVNLRIPKEVSETSCFASTAPCGDTDSRQPENPRRWR